MRKIEILDCTLRDGGYINNWEFGINEIKKIINTLDSSKIDYVECGFLKNKSQNFNINRTIFSNLEEVEPLVREYKKSMFTLMIPMNDYNIKQLPRYTGGNLSVIRLSFHKDDIKNIEKYSIQIINHGYRLFLQPTVTMNYNTNELKYLIKLCNEVIHPESVGIVDTLGEMTPKDVRKMVEIFDKYLNADIKLLFHGHNSLQLAFSNAMTFIDSTSPERDIIIDTTLHGIGRDAGNVCTELGVFYLNKYFNKKYDYERILELINEDIIKIKNSYKWGYSLKSLLNATNNTHPKYSEFFLKNDNKISVNQLNNILSNIPYGEKANFNIDIARKIIENIDIK